jgi:hypothetical protein
MILVQIGNEERRYDQADAQWITQQITRRRADGLIPCVRVTINASGLNLTLATPGCPSGGAGGRLPTQREKAIFELWQERGLNNSDFAPGSIISFLQQMRNSF